MEFHRGPSLKFIKHEIYESKKTIQEALLVSDVVVTGVPNPDYKLSAENMKEGVVAINFSTFKNMGIFIL
jgi:methylenetetrahydrofolate dehydrogenase (NAD+)